MEHVYKDKSYNVGLWKMLNLDKYDRMRHNNYVQANIIALCFAASSPPSFDLIRTKYHPEIATVAPNVPIIVICTRIDAREDDSIGHALQQNYGRGCITTGEGSDFSDEIGALHYFETSASTGEGFSEIANKVLESLTDESNGPNNRKAACILL